MIISSVCAMAKGRVIGRQGTIPWRLPSDLAHFKRLTMGHPIIMGRKTFASLGRALPGRTNIVLSRQSGFAVCGGIVCPSLDRALELVADADECFIIGGAQLYADALPIIQRQYLSLLQTEFEGDAFYPEIDPEHWLLKNYRSFPDDVYPWAYIELERREDA
ncbi:dihydrofolate reductase [bacterium]|nr:dihydrofolate reductase [bacterium]